MNIKQTFAVITLFVFATIGSVFMADVPSAQALTKSEKKTCYEKWAGRTQGSAGSGSSFNENTFNKDNCSKKKGGSCKIIRYSDGAVIHCQRADGKYDNGSAGFGGTTGGSSGNTGDGGTDSGSTGSTIGGDDCGGVRTAIIKCSQDNKGSNVEDNAIWGLLLMAINILTAGVGVLAVGGIVYGAFLYTTAEDKADQVKKATDIITNVVIGLVAFALMYAGLNFLIPGGVFS